MKENILGIKQV